jgi:hypothetical protein
MEPIVDLIKTSWNTLRNKVFQHPKLRDEVIEMGLKIQNDKISLPFYLIDINKQEVNSIIEKLIKEVFSESKFNFIKEIQYVPFYMPFGEINENYNMQASPHFRDDTLDLYDFRPQKTKNRYIFKYIPINENLNKLLVNNTFWFGAAAKFNDAFDSRFIFDDIKKGISDGTKIISAYRIKYQRVYDPLGDNPGFEELSQTDISQTDQQFRGEIEEHHFQTLISPYFGVCSFSEKYEEQLMWSHYTDSYKGVCLVFDREFDDKYLGISKVLYRNTLPKIFWDSQDKVIESIFFTKHKRWSYENELRKVVRANNLQVPLEDSERSVEFTPKSLIGVIFGHNCSFIDRQTIKNLIEQLPKYTNIQFWDAVPNIQEQKIDVNSGNFDLKETFDK